MIVPGVLPGSIGPLLYLHDEIEQTATAWNGVPIILDHPKKGSGQTQAVWTSSGLGRVKNAEINNKLVAEAWFDIDKTNSVNPRIIPIIESGQRLEVSTGVRLDLDQTPGVTNEGVAYTAIARNHRPDHLAVFLNQKGACSLGDGCGINNKSTQTETGEIKMPTLKDKTRKEKIDNLITNCKCWEETDREVLNETGDKELDLFTTAFNSSALVEKHEKTIAENQTVIEKQEVTIAENALHGHSPKEIEKIKKGRLIEDEEEENKGKTKMAKNEITIPEKAEPIKLSDLPFDLQEDILFARNQRKTEKTALIVQLVANVSEDQRQTQGERLAKRSLSELQADVALLPKADPVQNTFDSVPDYTGQAVVNNVAKEFKPEPLGIPVMNYDPIKD